MAHGLSEGIVNEVLKRSMPSFQLTSEREQNLGLGYLYYGLARAMRPRKTVVVGSKAGFAPLCFALGMADNSGSWISRIDCAEVSTLDRPGTLDFIDPSYSKAAGDPGHSHGIGYWSSPEVAESLWREFGVAHVATHFKQTSADYIANLPDDFTIDLLYIDGDHSYEGILHDFMAFLPYLGGDSLVLAHDVDPRCRSARGYQVLRDLPPDIYQATRIPIYPGLAVMLPVRADVRARRFCSPPPIGGDHSV